MFFKDLIENIRKVKEEDPAARNSLEVFLLYPGIHAYIFYRFSHFLYNIKLKFLARFISEVGRFFTGIEIHPRSRNWKEIFYRSWHGSSNW